jgi:hypothetical protein
MLIILAIIAAFIIIHYFFPNFFISIIESLGGFLILLLISSLGGYFVSIIFTILGFPYDVFWYAMFIIGYLFYRDIKKNE